MQDGLRHEGISRYYGICTNNGLATKNGCIRIDNYIVLYGWMTFDTGQLLALSGRQRTKGNPQIDFYIISNIGSFSINDSGSEVNKEIFTNIGTRIDINSCLTMCIFCHDPWNKRHLHLIEHMCISVYKYRK